MRLYLKILKEEKSGLAWLGMWFKEQATQIRNAIDSASLTLREYRVLRNTVKKLCAEAVKIVRKHDEAIVLKEIIDEQQPGLTQDQLQYNINVELSRGELQRKLYRRLRVNKKLKWDNFEQSGIQKKAKKDIGDSDEDSQVDNNQLYMEGLMKDPFENGPKSDDDRNSMSSAGKRPAEWECWKKKKKKKKKSAGD
jgi:hypothetical protein